MADLGWSLIKGVEAHKRVELDTKLVRLGCIFLDPAFIPMIGPHITM